MKYEKGLHEVADGVWAYLQPDGGWGWSNAGLIAGNGTSLLVDTLFDLRLTQEMLDSMRRATPAAAQIGTLVNTHSNGDHCFGNALVTGAQIVASSKCAAEMRPDAASQLAKFVAAAPGLGQMGAFVQKIFAPFTFEGIEVALPDRTFDGELHLRVGERSVSLLEVGPAHTDGDVVVHLPGDGVVFTGDIVFHGGHPIVWAGPVANWIAACDRLLSLGADTIVPGHGPIGTPSAVSDLKEYFEYLSTEARCRYDSGMNARDAARDIDMSAYAGWGEAERVVINVFALYRDFGAELPEDLKTTFGAMAETA